MKLVTYGTIWGATFGSALLILTILRSIRNSPSTLLFAAVAGGVAVAIEALTDRINSTSD